MTKLHRNRKPAIWRSFTIMSCGTVRQCRGIRGQVGIRAVYLCIHPRCTDGANAVHRQDPWHCSPTQGRHQIWLGPCIPARGFPANLCRNGQESQKHDLTQVTLLQRLPARKICAVSCSWEPVKDMLHLPAEALMIPPDTHIITGLGACTKMQMKLQSTAPACDFQLAAMEDTSSYIRHTFCAQSGGSMMSCNPCLQPHLLSFGAPWAHINSAAPNIARGH